MGAWFLVLGVVLTLPRSASSKIESIDKLCHVSGECRKYGRKVVLAHGTFDLLHLGHVKHLEAARREGDVLIVTVTADAFVGKGPGRPVFREHLRAEMVASLECVDWVGINHDADAVGLIERMKPGIYVKGADYRDGRDLTDRIGVEQEAVYRNGGRFVFTDEETTFSSSALINRHLDVVGPNVRDFLDKAREDGTRERVLKAVDALSNLRVLFIGDTIIDEYRYVLPLGKSPKENMIACLYREREVFAGGVIAAANHAASFCKAVGVLTSFSEEDKDIVAPAVKDNVFVHRISRERVPTTRKVRFVDTAYNLRKLFEVYEMDDSPLPRKPEDELIGLVRDYLPRSDVVVVADFGHGLMTQMVIKELKNARFLAANAQTNAANIGFNPITRYDFADYLCLDAYEARIAMQDKHATMEQVLSWLGERVGSGSRIVVTEGRHGAHARMPDGSVVTVPALTEQIVDTVGAGDAFFSVTAPLAALGLPAADLAFVGNLAGALKVGIVGHRESVSKTALLRYMTTLLK